MGSVRLTKMKCFIGSLILLSFLNYLYARPNVVDFEVKTVLTDPQTGRTIWQMTHSATHHNIHGYYDVCPWNSATNEIVFSSAENWHVKGDEQKYKDGVASVWIMDEDGENLRCIAENKYFKCHAGCHPRWSHDGTKLLYGTSGDKFYVYDVRTSSTETIDGLRGRDWHPDNVRIACQTTQKDRAIIFSLADHSRSTIVDFNDIKHADPDLDPAKYRYWREVANLKWSPDGSKLLVRAYVNYDGQETMMLYVVNDDGLGLRRVKNMPAGWHHHGWHPKGNKIIFGTGGIGPLTRMYTINPDGTDLHLVTKGLSGHARYSPDGSMIVSEWDYDGLYLVDPDTGEKEKLVTLNKQVPQHATHPHATFSHDGKYIIYNDSTKYGTWQIFVVPLERNPLTKASKKVKRSIKLSVLEPLGIDRPQYPVTMGVPFPKGVLKSTENLSLEADGKALPLQARTMLTWPDGSIKWVLLDFQRDLVASEENLCTLNFGDKVKSSATLQKRIKVTNIEAGVKVSTGPLVFTVVKDGMLPLESASLNGREILPVGAIDSGMKVDGISYQIKSIEEPVIEEPGPLRVVVKVDGKAVAEDGKTSFDVTTRIYSYAGLPTLRIYFTLINKIPVKKVHLENCYLTLEPAFRGNVDGFIVSSIHVEHSGKAYVDNLIDGKRCFRIGTVDAPFKPWVPPATGPKPYETAEQVQRAAPQYSIIPGDDGEAETLHTGANWARLVPAAAVLGDEQTTITFACRHPWHNAPKEVNITTKAIRLDLYPEWAEPLEWYRGVAKTHEILLDLRAGEAEQRERIFFVGGFEKQPAPQVATRNWMLDSDAFGKIFRYQPKKYPWWEFVFRKAVTSQIFNFEAKNEKGFTILNYGDTWRTGRGGQWGNNEMDAGFGLILQMVRTGYQKTMEGIEPIIHHQIDVDTIHDAEDEVWIGGQCYHFAKHGAARRPALCHQWLEGPLFYYLLTGYKRAEEVALARADHFCNATDAGWLRFKSLPRVQGYPLMSLARMYDCYRDQKYERACGKILDWLEQWYEEEGGLRMPFFSPPGGRSKMSGGLTDGVAACALMRHYTVTGNKRSWKMLKRLVDDGIEKHHLFTPEGFILKTTNQFRDYFGPEPDFYFEPLAYLTQKTGSERYAKLGYINLQRLFAERSMMSRSYSDPVLYRYWLPALALFDELGMLTDPKPW